MKVMEHPSMKTRDTPGGGMEVLDADCVWRTVPHAMHEFVRQSAPADGFTRWEWMIGQVYAAGVVPRGGLKVLSPTVEDEARFKEAHAFEEAYKARFPEQVAKFAKYMGWDQPTSTE